MNYLLSINSIRKFVDVGKDQTIEEAVTKWTESFKLGQNLQNFKANLTANGYWMDAIDIGERKSIDGVYIGFKPILDKLGYEQPAGCLTKEELASGII